MAATKSLDEKLARIHADPHGARDFILADAKDADMGFGIAALIIILNLKLSFDLISAL